MPACFSPSFSSEAFFLNFDRVGYTAQFDERKMILNRYSDISMILMLRRIDVTNMYVDS